MGEFRPVYSAFVRTDNLNLMFMRLYEDVTDPMSDDHRPTWKAQDNFIIQVRKLETEHIHTEEKISDVSTLVTVGKKNKELERFEVETKNKKAANYIWWIAKHGASYETIKEVMKKL